MTGSAPRLLADQVSLPQGMPEQLPPAREFLTSAGFAGTTVLLGAIIVAVVAGFAVRAAFKRHRMLVEQRGRRARIQECRERLAWVVDKASVEPAASEGATVGVGPELAMTVLQGIHDDAESLGDATLAMAAAVQLDQLSRMLARQSGALSHFGAVNSAAVASSSGEEATSEAGPAAPATTSGDEPSTPARKVATGGRRRRP